MSAFQDHEWKHRDAVEAAILRWCQYGELGRVPPSAEFWLAARFEHAWWLASQMTSPDPDGVLRYLPIQNGRLLSGFREWLLVHSWNHSGVEAFFRA